MADTEAGLATLGGADEEDYMVELQRRIQEQLEGHDATVSAARNKLESHEAFLATVLGEQPDSAQNAGAAPSENQQCSAAELDHEEALQAEVKDATFKPEINAESVRIARKQAEKRTGATGEPAVPVEDRLQRKLRQYRESREKKLEEERKKSEMPESTLVHDLFRTVRPPGSGPPIGERSREWVAARAERIERLKRSKAEEEERAAPMTPRINPRSTAIASRTRTAQQAADELFEQAKASQAARREREEARPRPVSPALTPRAKAMARPGSASERLFQGASQREARRRQLKEDMEEAAQTAHATESAARRSRYHDAWLARSEQGQREAAEAMGVPFAPAPTPGSPRRGEVVPRSEWMYRRAELLRTKQALRVAKEEAAASAQATPQLNRRSLAIAEALPQSARERLTAPREASTQQEKGQGWSRLAGSTLGSTAQAGPAAQDGAVAARAMARLYAESEDRRQRQLQREQEREERESSGCTFRPELSTSQRAVQPATASGPTEGGSPNRVAARSKTWAEARERRLEAARAQAAAEAAAEEEEEARRARPALSARGQRAQPRYTQMTAATRASLTTPDDVELGPSPAAGTRRSAARSQSAGPTRPGAAAPSNKGPAKSAAVRAHEAFLMRQARARELHRERVTVPHKTGDGWTGRSTEPVGPSFLHRAKSHSRARPQAASVRGSAAQTAARAGKRRVPSAGAADRDPAAVDGAGGSVQSPEEPALMERPPNLRQPRPQWAGGDQEEGERTLLSSLTPEMRAAVEEARRDALRDPPAGRNGAPGWGRGEVATPVEDDEEEEEVKVTEEEDGEGEEGGWPVPTSAPPPPAQHSLRGASPGWEGHGGMAGSREPWSNGGDHGYFNRDGGTAEHLMAMQQAARSLELAAEGDEYGGGDDAEAVQRPRRAAPRRPRPPATDTGRHDAVNAVMPEPQLKRSQQRSLEKYYQRMRKAKKST